MVDLKKEADTLAIDNIEEELAEALTEEMKIAGSSNDMEHSQYVRGGEVDLVGDGVPPYETDGEAHPMDEAYDKLDSETDEENAFNPKPPHP